jgi:dipeptidyl aminopeptidase/acylaminoacyl peptidase
MAVGARDPVMKRFPRIRVGWLMLAAAFGDTVMAEEIKPPANWTPELMIQIKRIGSVQVSPDGKRAAFAVKSAVLSDNRSEYQTHVHLGIVGEGTSRQLTQGEASCDDPQWSPDGQWLAFVSARSGVKNLWLIRPDGGEAIPLTEVRTEISGYKWAPDGRSVAFTALDAATPEEDAAKKSKGDVRIVDENVKRQRLYVVPVTSPPVTQKQARLLTPGDMNVGGDLFRPANPPFDWSPDGTSIVFSHASSPRPEDWPSADLSIVTVANGAIRSLVKSHAAETAPYFSPDGTQIAYLASDDPPTWAGRKSLRVISANGGESKSLAETFDGFGRYSELLGWSADGKKLYFTETHGTVLKLMAMPLTGLPIAVSDGEGMSAGGMFLNAPRTHVGFGWETLTAPMEAYASRVDAWKPVRLGSVQVANLPKICRTELLTWKSSDGLEIEGLLTYPKDYVKGKRYPLLLVIHGGPMGVFTQTCDGSPERYPIAAFADRGYALLRPNPRGSSGYGAKFRYANYGDWGGGDFQDLMAGVDHVIDMGLADADRLGVMGWSYGGYMTSWTITQTQRFKAASVGAGVTNLMSFSGTSDIPGFLPDYFHGEFWDNVEIYRSRSPMAQIRGVRTPTLIQHGERDERVPLSQGQELYNALKRQGCETQMVIYPRTPHGIEEPRLLLDCMRRNLAWFDRFLGQPAERSRERE